MNNPDCLRLFSITLDISAPISSKLISFLKKEFETLSWNNGDTAIGNGLRLPLVISTSIREYDFEEFKTKTTKK